MRMLRRLTFTDQAVESIKTYISSNNLSPGDKLPSQRELCEVLCVSNSVIREAIKSLETLGIVTIRSGDGIYVSDFNYGKLVGHVGFILEQNGGETQDVCSLAEARRCLESGVLELVVEKLDEKSIRRLDGIVERMRRTTSSDEFSALDLEFHKAIIGITGNRILIEFCKLIDEFFKYRDDHMEPPVIRADAENHARMLEMLKTGDVTGLRTRTAYNHDLKWESSVGSAQR